MSSYFYVCLLTMKICKLITFCFALICFSLNAQNSEWQNFGIKEGLPQSNISSIVQDSIGYIWLGTQGSGLVRFDGKDFKILNEKDSLLSGFINDLVFKKDSLFIATNQGLSVMSNGTIKSFRTPKINKIIPLQNQFFLATDSGIYQWKGTYIIPLKIDYKVDLNVVNDLIFHQNSFYIATNKALWQTNTLIKSTNSEKISNGKFTSFLKIQNKLYANNKLSGIYEVRKKQLLLKKKTNSIEEIQLIENEILMLTSNEGIKKSDSEFKNTQLVHSELKSDKIQDIFKDKTNSIWIASANRGLFKFTKNNFEHFTTKKGLSNNKINALVPHGENLWIASGNKGIQKKIGAHFINLGIEELQNTTVNSIAIDSSNNIWLGTESKGLLLLKYKSQKDSIKNTAEEILDTLSSSYQFINLAIQLPNIGKSIQSIYEKDSKVWIADGRFIHELTTKNGIILKTKIFGKNQGFKDTKINSFFYRKNKLWYSSSAGNLGYIKDRNLIDYYQPLGFKTSINCISEKNGYLFLGTSNRGVWLVSVNNPKDAFQLKGIKKLNSQYVNQLLFDASGDLWVGTEKGLNKVILNKNSIKDVFYFSKNDGFLGVETTQNSIALTKDQNLWFGTNNGLTKLVNLQTKNSTIKPTVFIENLEVLYNKIDTVNVNSYSKTLNLKANQNSLSFEYKTVDIDNPNEIQYQWRLNENVSSWTSKNSIDFANLSSGSYTFEVVSMNRNSVKSKTKRFQFYIHKPWYLQNWFLISSAVIGTFLIVFIVFSYTQKLKRKAKAEIQILKTKNQLIALEQKALQLQMNPHFVFNVLNSIKAFGSNGKLESMNTIINEFATLLRGVLLNSREEFVTLKSEIDILKSYLKIEEKLQNKSFTIIIDIELDYFDSEEVLIPSMILQPFIENSIKHAFKIENRENKIKIQLDLKEKFMYCSISDNGVGYKTSQKNKNKQHKSVAINVTKERLESLIQYPNFSIKEIKENQEVKGTCVSFHMPYQTDF